jgi:hypothetical protein
MPRKALLFQCVCGFYAADLGISATLKKRHGSHVSQQAGGQVGKIQVFPCAYNASPSAPTRGALIAKILSAMPLLSQDNRYKPSKTNISSLPSQDHPRKGGDHAIDRLSVLVSDAESSANN